MIDAVDNPHKNDLVDTLGGKEEETGSSWKFPDLYRVTEWWIFSRE